MDKYEMYAILFFAIISLSESTSPTPSEASPQPKPNPPKQAPASNKRSDDFDLPRMMQASTHLNSYKPQFQFANRPEPAGWYGFNHFVTRSARHLPFPTERRLRAATFLGEGTQLFPMTTFLQSPSIFEPVDLHTLGSVQHYDPFLPPRIVMMDPALKVPRGVLIPVVRQRQPPPPAFAKRQRSFPTTSRNSGLQTSANAPTPVTLKIIPLKLTSVDIANALKSVSWMPIPINFMKTNGNDGQEQQTYNDKRQTMFDDDHDDSDLPPPSSHVATPLGITYAEGRRSERFLKKFPPRM